MSKRSIASEVVADADDQAGESPDARERPALPRGREAALFIGSLAVVIGCVLWAHLDAGVLPLHDGPQHVFLGHLENVFDDPSTGYQDFLERGAPITSRGFSVIFEPLDALLGWRWAQQASLAVALLIWTLGFTILVLVLHPRRWPLALLGAATAIQWPYYIGLWSFFIANGIGFLTLAWAIRAPSESWRQWFVTGALLLLQAMCHSFPTFLTGVALLSIAASSRTPLRALVRLVVVAIPSAALTLLSALAVEEVSEGAGFVGTGWLPWGDRVEVFLGALSCGPLWRSVPIVVIGLVGIAITAFLWRASLRSSLLGAAALAMLTTAMLTPVHLSSWQFFSPRFVPIGVMLAVALVPLERVRSRQLLWGLTALALLYAVSSNLWAWSLNKELSLAARDAMTGLDVPLRRSGPRLTLVVDQFLAYDDTDRSWSNIPYFQPTRSLGQLYATAQGGLPPFNFMRSPTYHNFVLRRSFSRPYPNVPDASLYEPLVFGPEAPNPVRRQEVLARYAAAGRFFEDFIVFGSNGDVEALLARGYLADFRSNGLLLAHFQGCPFAVEVPAHSREVVVEYGLLPGSEVDGSQLLEPKDQARRVELESAPCGPVWISVFALDGEERRPLCRGSDARGRRVADLVTGGHLNCESQAE